MLKNVKIRIIVFMTVIISGCSNFFCENDAGIEVSELTKYYTSKREIPYCKLLKDAINKDK